MAQQTTPATPIVARIATSPWNPNIAMKADVRRTLQIVIPLTGLLLDPTRPTM